LDRRVPTPTRLAPWQHEDLDALGVTLAEVDAAVVLVDVTWRRSSGPTAIARYLRSSSSPAWRAVGSVIARRPLRWLTAPIYRLIARNRHRMPGGTPQCSLPVADRGARSLRP
jgi:predicted DCC family thiol-disulfide oxidoreductase YuxK